MNWGTLRPRLGLVARLVLGVVWIWSSWSKLDNPRQFLRAVRAYDATPEWLSKAIAYGLPVLEFALGVLLIIGLLTRAVAGVSAALLVIFLIGIIQAAARGLKLDCGCFGGGGLTDDTQYLLESARDVGLLVLAVFLILYPITWWSVDQRRAAADAVPELTPRQRRSERNVARYKAMVAAQRRATRSRDLFLLGSVVLIVGAVVLTGIGVQAQRAQLSGSLEATYANAKDGVTVGSVGAPVTVDVYEDFQCPLCNDFEQENGQAISGLITDGKIKVNYHPMAFLDSASNGNRYSSRAANAALCASDENPSVFLSYHGVLFGKSMQGPDNQPAEGSDGRTDDELIGYGTEAGVSNTSLFNSCVQGQTHKALVEAITDEASKRGVTGTPTFYINGSKFSGDRSTFMDALTAAIDKAVAGGKTPVPYASPTPSPTDTASPDATASPTANGSPTATGS